MNGLIIHYEEYGNQLDMLNTEQKGMLLESLIAAAKGQEPDADMDNLTLMCFSFMRDRMLRDNELSKKRARSAQSRWNTNDDANGCKTMQNDANKSKREAKRCSNTNTNTNTNTDKKDICASDPVPDEAEEMFRKVWDLYPNKKGLGSVSKSQKEKLFKEVGEDHLIRALNRYLDEHRKKEQRGDFVPPWQNGSTWFNRGFEDFLDANFHPAPVDAKPKKAALGFNNYETQSDTNWDEIAFEIMEKEENG